MKVKIFLISICILFLIGCTVDLDKETKEELQKIHTDCLGLKEDIEELIEIINFYAYQEYDGGVLAREALEKGVE